MLWPCSLAACARAVLMSSAWRSQLASHGTGAFRACSSHGLYSLQFCAAVFTFQLTSVIGWVCCSHAYKTVFLLRADRLASLQLQRSEHCTKKWALMLRVMPNSWKGKVSCRCIAAGIERIFSPQCDSRKLIIVLNGSGNEESQC